MQYEALPALFQKLQNSKLLAATTAGPMLGASHPMLLNLNLRQAGSLQLQDFGQTSKKSEAFKNDTGLQLVGALQKNISMNKRSASSLTLT
jgi:hypothetical protein